MKQAMHGYILPATVLLGLGTAILAATFAQIVMSSSQTLNTQTYNQMAEEAATAGAIYANSCAVASTPNWTDALTPSSSCSGGSGGYVLSSSNLRTTFSVAPPVSPAGRLNAVSTGTVEQHVGGGQWITIATTTKRIAFSDATTAIPVATGPVITDLSSEVYSCAIANGELYCWGYNTYGELGLGNNGNSTHRASPRKVAASSGQAFYNKVVTKVAVGNGTTCAIADGQLYCWGRNHDGQIGDGTTTNRNSPTLVGGALAGKKVTDVSVTQGRDEDLSVCALADGVPYCWGTGRLQQLGQRPYVCTYPPWPWPGCGIIGALPIDSGNKNRPIPIWGYRVDSNDAVADSFRYNVEAGSPMYQKKATSVVVGGSMGGAIAEGNVYSWGNTLTGGAIPNYVSQIGGLYNTYPPQPKSLIANDSIICAVGNIRLLCYGQHDAVTSLAVSPYPQEVGAPTGDIQSHDAGSEPVDFAFITNDIYCILTTNAAIYCSGRGSYTGTGHSGPYEFRPLLPSPAMTGKVATKVTVGRDYGCFVANGSLLCWGREDAGQLGNGVPLASTSTPDMRTVLSGDGEIGTTCDNSIGSPIPGATSAEHCGAAATGPLSVGEDHACGVANGRLYCWGRNNSGQLGNGTTTDQFEPTSVASPLAGRVVSKVSAGTAHTCAISDGQLYCWGNGANGRLGTGGSSTSNVPVLVEGNFTGKRVTDVSAGATGTCAIADSRPYCWGMNTSQQVGDGTTTQRSIPTPVDGNSDVIWGADKSVSSITMGETHACAVVNGNGFCWGNQADGRLGNGSSAAGNQPPTAITGGTAGTPIANYITPNFTDISAGSNFTCAIINGTANCWGNNTDNRTGRSGNSNTPGVVTNASGLTATAISAGNSHACAVLNGRSYCWGSSADGRLGNSATSGDQMSATHIDQADNAGKATIAIAAGGASTCNVANGTIQCWGSKANGRLGIGTRLGNAGSAGSAAWPTITNAYRASGAFTKGVIY